MHLVLQLLFAYLKEIAWSCSWAICYELLEIYNRIRTRLVLYVVRVFRTGDCCRVSQFVPVSVRSKDPSTLCTAFTVLRAINSLLTVFSVAGKLEILCTRLELGYAHGENYLFVFPMIVSKISRPNLNLIWVFCLWFLSLSMIRLAFCIRFGYLT